MVQVEMSQQARMWHADYYASIYNLQDLKGF